MYKSGYFDATQVPYATQKGEGAVRRNRVCSSLFHRHVRFAEAAGEHFRYQNLEFFKVVVVRLVGAIGGARTDA